MENRTAAITIEVDDDQFKRFHALFEKYQAAVGEMPAVWKDVQEGSKKAAENTKQTADNTERTVENTERTVEKEKEVTKEKEKQDSVFERIDGRREKANEQQENADRSHLDAIRDMIAALSAHNALIAEESQKRSDIARAEDRERAKREKEDRDRAKAQRDEEKKAEDAAKRQNKLLAERHKGFKAMGETLNGMIGSSMNIGLNIAKWGIGTGIGIIGGGVFGLDRLAGAATAERTRSRGLGVSPGELRAWRTEFGNYGDPEGLLEAASNAPTDAVTRSVFQRAGVNDSVIRSGNTSQIAEQALTGLSEFFQRNQGPNAQAIWNSRGYDQVIGYNQMRQFAAAPASEREQMFRNIHRDMRSMGTGDSEMKAWQDFYTQLQRSGQELKTTFLDGLVKLSGPIGDLSHNLTDVVREFMKSDGFKEVITTISQGLSDLSASIKDGEFKKDLEDFIKTLSDFAKSGELKEDLATLERAVHLAAKSVGWAVNTVDKSPIMGGPGWGEQKLVSDGNGGTKWVDNPDAGPGIGFSDAWDWLKSAFAPSKAHAGTIDQADLAKILNQPHAGTLEQATLADAINRSRRPEMDPYLNDVAHFGNLDRTDLTKTQSGTLDQDDLTKTRSEMLDQSDLLKARSGTTDQSDLINTLNEAQRSNMERYLAAIAQTESGGNPNAVSKAGAQGLFQLMPSVQKQYGVTNPFDPDQSKRGAVALITDLFRQFNGDPIKATAAYNAGGGRVARAISQHGDDWLSYLPVETQQYVGRVSHNMQAGNVNIRINNVTGGSATVTASQAGAM